MADVLTELAVLIPVAPDDPEWRRLFDQLQALPAGAEVLFAGPRRPADLETGEPGGVTVRWVESAVGRARQLNAAARATVKPVLWFLHADTVLDDGSFDALRRAVAEDPAAIYYFDLAFLDDGPSPWLMSLNAWGTRLRSRWLGLPFGDQSYCLSRDAFEHLGGFDESREVGEDLYFVWAARQRGYRLRRVGATLRTSARKYSERGWLRTTAYHLRFSFLKSAPEWLRLLRQRGPRSGR